MHGVFDIDELVYILKSKNAEDIVVIEIDATAGFAEHMVIVSGKSTRHLEAVANFVRRVYKKKIEKGDLVPHLEGKKNKSEDWFALDLGMLQLLFCVLIFGDFSLRGSIYLLLAGNIVLHLFSKRTRAVYDLESLWALGPEFDPFLNQTQDPLAAIISKHSHYLADLQPADSK